ncbi:hypothetical protein BD779DRAFT_1671531 [Infundibulicybe gibba]|nr:hypothetical protein BD779DRAFT_1671531 [Infundibulicybe gibba]
MTPYFGPQEPASQVVLERYSLATDFISGIGYGAQAVLYVTCVRYLWRQRKARRMYKFMLAYITLLFLISTVAQEFPRGPWEYSMQSVGGATSIVGQAASAALLILSELFMVWRCWVVWYSVGQYVAYIIIILPLLMVLGSTIGAILYLVATVHPDLPFAGTHTPAWVTSYYVVIFSTNALVTIFILVRLIAHRRSMQRHFTRIHTGEYASLITMLIESSALYSIIGIGCMITSGVGIPVGNPFVSASISMQQISGYLIIARLAHGQAWQRNTVAESKFVAQRQESGSDIKRGNNVPYSGTDSTLGSASI